MRVHFISKDLEQRTKCNYRQTLTNTWNEINPTSQLYANLLANRVKWLLNNEKFTETELNVIKLSCYPRGAALEYDEVPVETVPTHGSSEERNLTPETGRLERQLLKNYFLYAGILPEGRPRIPRMRGSKKMLQRVQEVDNLIQKNSRNNWKLEDVTDFVYAGAITVCSELGMKIRDARSYKKETTPPWKCRLEKKITEIRRNIGILHTYLNTEAPSTRVEKLAH